MDDHHLNQIRFRWNAMNAVLTWVALPLAERNRVIDEIEETARGNEEPRAEHIRTALDALDALTNVAQILNLEQIAVDVHSLLDLHDGKQPPKR